MAKKSCKKGYYYCYASKKCKKIPMGYVVGMGGWLRKEREEEKSSDETEGKKKNGNGSNGNGNGNGGSDGGSDGGGVSEAWSAKYKKSIDCDNPKGFSQRAHCQGKKKVTEGKEGDHEVSMAKSQLKKSAENIAKLRKVLKKKTDKDNLPAWVQAKITDTEHNTDAAAGYMEEGKRDGKSAKDKGYSLRDWFKGGGWVQAGGKYDGKPCAKQPGQKTKPFCRDADDRANMSKDERERRAKKKRREDPNPNRKGKAKMVTDNYSNWRNELQLDEGMGLGLAAGAAALAAAPYLAKKFLKPKVDKAIDKQRKTAPIGGDRRVPQTEGYADDGDVIRPTDRIKMKDGKLRTLKDIDAKLKDKGTKKEEVELFDEANIGFSNPAIKGKPVPYPKGHPEEGKPMSFNKAETEGKNKYDRYYRKTGKRIPADQPLPPLTEEKILEGKKEDCYHKVKSRYSVGPSAYASGALVKCRKVGAKNWGNKTKKEGYEFSNWRDDFQAMDVESVDIIKAEPLQPTDGIGSRMLGEEVTKKDRLKEIAKQLKKASAMHAKQSKEVSKCADELDEAKKCWKGYKKVGTQKLFGKTYNRCEKIKEDWQKSNRNDGVDGMSQKSVNAYKRENPGSKLQTAVTEKKPTGKRAKRRKSFCARSKGQKDMHNIDCTKTPDKKICKARKRWRC